ncbi:succinate dehydrogenase iron-sulfur subunit [Enterobacter asburiae]|uniref:succinate dehydrogenase n=1 Tax=Enterobacter asburiae TaxID=61645 RepID=A0A376F5G5_ENTAS|nr:succinate dehydrogenase iron-sulfur subunit [Enterobacter asburiae]
MKLEFSVYRYNPDVDDAPRMQDYTLEAEEGRDMMLLDALIQLKEKDPTLSFRRSCREGVCGSDGVNMNGKNGPGLHHANFSAAASWSENCYPSSARPAGPCVIWW